jgi:hypothetical protein
MQDNCTSHILLVSTSTRTTNTFLTETGILLASESNCPALRLTAVDKHLLDIDHRNKKDMTRPASQGMPSRPESVPQRQRADHQGGACRSRHRESLPSSFSDVYTLSCPGMVASCLFASKHCLQQQFWDASGT